MRRNFSSSGLCAQEKYRASGEQLPGKAGSALGVHLSPQKRRALNKVQFVPSQLFALSLGLQAAWSHGESEPREVQCKQCKRQPKPGLLQLLASHKRTFSSNGSMQICLLSAALPRPHLLLQCELQGAKARQYDHVKNAKRGQSAARAQAGGELLPVSMSAV